MAALYGEVIDVDKARRKTVHRLGSVGLWTTARTENTTVPVHLLRDGSGQVFVYRGTTMLHEYSIPKEHP